MIKMSPVDAPLLTVVEATDSSVSLNLQLLSQKQWLGDPHFLPLSFHFPLYLPLLPIPSSQKQAPFSPLPFPICIICILYIKVCMSVYPCLFGHPRAWLRAMGSEPQTCDCSWLSEMYITYSKVQCLVIAIDSLLYLSLLLLHTVFNSLNVIVKDGSNLGQGQLPSNLSLAPKCDMKHCLTNSKYWHVGAFCGLQNMPKCVSSQALPWTPLGELRSISASKKNGFKT